MPAIISGVTAKTKGEHVRFSVQEVLCAGACVLFALGQPVSGSIFLSLGCIGAIFRVAIEMQAKQEKAKKQEESFEAVGQLGTSLAEILSSFADGLEGKKPRNYN